MCCWLCGLQQSLDHLLCTWYHANVPSHMSDKDVHDCKVTHSSRESQTWPFCWYWQQYMGASCWELICALICELQPSALIVPAVVQIFISTVHRTHKPRLLIQPTPKLYRRHVRAPERRKISSGERLAKLTVKTQRSTTILSASLASNEGRWIAAAYSKRRYVSKNEMSTNRARVCSYRCKTGHLLSVC